MIPRRTTASKISTNNDGWHYFEDAVPPTSRNLSLELIGPEQTGKNHIAFTMPSPIAHFDLDDNAGPTLANILRLYPATVIKRMLFEIPKGLVPTDKLQKQAVGERERLFEAWEWACKSDKVRSLVMDSGTDAWELWRYAEFGAESSRARNYGGLNSQFAAMLRLPRKYGKNVVIINRTKDEWRDDKPTGRVVRDGFKNTGYTMHATIETLRDDYDNFSIKLRDVRHNAGLNGTVYTPADLGGELTFQMIAATIVEGSEPYEWQ